MRFTNVATCMSVLLMMAAPALARHHGDVNSSVKPLGSTTTDVANAVTAYNTSSDLSLQVSVQSGPSYQLTNIANQFATGILGVNLPDLGEGTLNEKITSFNNVNCTYVASENLSTAADGPFLTATVQTKDGLYHANVGDSTKTSGSGSTKVFTYKTQGLAKWTPPITNALTGGKDVIQAALVFTGAADQSTNTVQLSAFDVNGGTTLVPIDATFSLFPSSTSSGADAVFNFTDF